MRRSGIEYYSVSFENNGSAIWIITLNTIRTRRINLNNTIRKIALSKLALRIQIILMKFSARRIHFFNFATF